MRGVWRYLNDISLYQLPLLTILNGGSEHFTGAKGFRVDHRSASDEDCFTVHHDKEIRDLLVQFRLSIFVASRKQRAANIIRVEDLAGYAFRFILQVPHLLFHLQELLL